MPSVQGRGASPGTVTGILAIVRSMTDAAAVQSNEVVLVATSDPRFVVAVGRARGVIADIGGVTCHLASIARELNIPCVVGTNSLMSILEPGTTVTLDGTAGCVTW